MAEDLTPGAVLQIVQQYARAMGLEKLAPHDMRRTCAKLCRKRGGDLEQIKSCSAVALHSNPGF
jgi:integrase